MDNAPFDLPAVHIFKIWGGQIHEISGWSTWDQGMSDAMRDVTVE